MTPPREEWALDTRRLGRELIRLEWARVKQGV